MTAPGSNLGAHPDAPVPATGVTAAPPAPRPNVTAPSGGGMRRLVYVAIGGVVGIALLFFGIPWLIRALTTVSTDDAYVNGHVTFVAARVPGQVKAVYVDDNMKVRAGQTLVELDDEPYV